MVLIILTAGFFMKKSCRHTQAQTAFTKRSVPAPDVEIVILYPQKRDTLAVQRETSRKETLPNTTGEVGHQFQPCIQVRNGGAHSNVCYKHVVASIIHHGEASQDMHRYSKDTMQRMHADAFR